MRHLLTLVVCVLSFFILQRMHGQSIETTFLKASTSSCGCTLIQGENSYDLDFFSTPETAIEFYNYGSPIGSSANTGFEISNGMIIMIHENTNNGETSLVLILDQANDGDGGSAFITFNCLPSNADVIFSDDGGEITGSAPNIVGNFAWAPCCTDGGIIDDIGCGDTFTINPDIGSGIDLFTILSGDSTDPEYTDMEEVNCPIIIDCGGASCCEEAFEFTATSENASCAESEDGSIDLTVECADDPSFEWSNGATTEDLENVSGGFYTVTITDANGCALDGTFLIDSNPSPEPEIDGPSVLCIGEDDVITVGVDDEYEDYDWSNGDFDQNIEITEGGTYTVTVTDDVGCTGVAEIVVMEIPIPEPVIEGPSETCEDYDIILDAGDGYISYDWSSGEASQSIYVYEEGTYTVTVTNDYGCSGVTSVYITAHPNPEVDIEGSTEICDGDVIILDAGDGFEEYSWSTGANSQTILVDEDGDYEVTVTNEFGCTDTEWYYVDPAESPEPEIDGENNLCIESEITLSVGGGYETYLWSTGNEGQSISTTQAGTYSVTVTNSDDCEGIAEFTILDLQPDTTLINLNSCIPQDTGVFVTQLENIYGCDSTTILTINYSESDSVFIFGSSCNPLDTGQFIQHLTNQFGCDSVSIECIDLLPTDSLVFNQVSCNPIDTGSVFANYINQYGCDSMVIIHTTLMLADTTYLFDNTCDPSSAGVFESLLIGDDGCDSLIITETALSPSDTSYVDIQTCNPLEVDTIFTTLINAQGCDSLVVTQISQLPSDTIWLFYESCSILDTGTLYTVYSNAAGCDSLVFEQTSLLPPSACLLELELQTDTIGCGIEAGTILINVTGGEAPYQYSWQSGNIITGTGMIEFENEFFEITDLPAGQITISVNDNYGYANTITASILELEPISFNLNSQDLRCFEDNLGEASVNNISGGLNDYSIEWSNSAQTLEINDLQSGWYYVTVYDNFGCQTIDSVFISQPNPLESESIVEAGDCNTNGLASLYIDFIEGGTEPYQFSINNEDWQTEQLIDGIEAGDYTLTIQDANGCEIFSDFEIDEYIETELHLGEDFSIKEGQTTSITAELNLNITELDTFYWEGIECGSCLTITVSPSQNTSYTAVAIDSFGCEVRSDIFIEVIVPLEIYTPNIFSPDRDGINDHFTIYSNYSTVMIEELRVFNRWGDMVYSGQEFPVNQPQYGWDGFFNGKNITGGVFVYQAVLRFEDDTTEIIHGDLTITR